MYIWWRGLVVCYRLRLRSYKRGVITNPTRGRFSEIISSKNYSGKSFLKILFPRSSEENSAEFDLLRKNPYENIFPGVNDISFKKHK
jgi:hypothetical protein